MKNYAYKLMGEIGVRFLSAGFLLILARLAGAAEFGVYSTAFAFATVFGLVIDLGTNPIVTREIARFPEKRIHIISTVNFLKTLMSLVMLGSLWGVSLTLSAEKARLVHWFGWVVIGTAFTEYYGAIFTGLERMGDEAILKVVSKGIVIMGALAALFMTRDVLKTVQVMGVFSILSLVVAAGLIRYHLGTYEFHLDWTYIKTLMTQSLPIFGSMAFLIIYDSQDILMLNYFKVADHNIGLFAMALKVIDVFKVLPVLLATTYLPALAREAHLSPPAFLTKAKELMRNTIIGFPLLAVTAYLLAPWIIQLLYGSENIAAVPTLRWLLVGFLIMSINLILMQILIALDKEKQLLIGSAIVCISNLAVSAALIPRYGILGTCYALIVSEILYLAIQGYLVFQMYLLLSDRREEPA